MKKFLFILLLFPAVLVHSQVKKAIPSKPSPSEGLVLDYTKKFITPEQEQYLERKLKAYDDSTSNQVVIVVVNDLKGYDANQFATAIGDTWGVGGSAQFDNGVVILVSTGLRPGDRDAYIAVGRGLEGAIPDITAKHISENELIANFKDGNYYRGLDATVNAIIKAAAGEYKAPKGYGKGKGIRPGQIFLIILVIWIILGVIGKSGKGGGGYASRRGYRGFGGPFWWGAGSGLGGGSGGGWSGGGGGFGGFGGGGFGGGGAGGKW